MCFFIVYDDDDDGTEQLEKKEKKFLFLCAIDSFRRVQIAVCIYRYGWDIIYLSIHSTIVSLCIHAWK